MLYQILWPENRMVDEQKIAMWYGDAVANGECESGCTDSQDQANALSDAGLITLGKSRSETLGDLDLYDAKIPADHAAAIAAIVELDVAKWGEGERAASTALRSKELPTYGLALNSLAHRPEYDFGDACRELVAAAKKALTPADREILRKGG